MLTTKKLNAKRRRKEVKRASKRRDIFLKKVKALKGRKARILRAKALRVIFNNPDLLQKYLENRQKIQAERQKRKEAAKVQA